jgi:cell division protein FtsW
MAMSTRSSGVPRSTARPVRGTAGVSARAAATDTGGRAATISLGRSFAAESGNYFLLLGTTLFLVLFGLVMVLSSSTIDSFNADQGFFGSFLRQGMYAVIGVPLMLIVSSVPSLFWKKRAWLIMGAAAVLQLLVVATPLGIEVYGNRNWISLGPITAQPSELVKVGLVIWLAFILARKRHLLNSWPHVLIPIGPVAGGSIGLVLLGSDLGTVIILASIVVGALFFAGVPVRMLAIIVAAGAAGAVLMTLISPNRMVRVLGFLNGTTDYEGSGWQATHGLYALAAGGVFGVGLGNSKAKWSWLPAADNDYIFAIIGEELGLIGAVVLLLLFVVMAIAFIRIIRSTNDPFSRVLVGSVMVWIIGQAFVNIAVVLQLLPVLGVPLPLMSSGGSALITTLVAIGVVLGIARRPPDAEDPVAPPLGAPARGVRS